MKYLNMTYALVGITAILGVELGFAAWYDSKHPQPKTYQRLNVTPECINGKIQKTVEVEGVKYALNLGEKSIDCKAEK